jgi:hypothetical protein
MSLIPGPHIPFIILPTINPNPTPAKFPIRSKKLNTLQGINSCTNSVNVAKTKTTRMNLFNELILNNVNPKILPA